MLYSQIEQIGNQYFQYLGAHKFFCQASKKLLVAFGLGYFLLACVWPFLAESEERDEYGGYLQAPSKWRARIYQLYQFQSYKVPTIYKGPKKGSHTENESLPKKCFFSKCVVLVLVLVVVLVLVLVVVLVLVLVLVLLVVVIFIFFSGRGVWVVLIFCIEYDYSKQYTR